MRQPRDGRIVTDVAVRRGTAADVDAVRRVAERSWTAAYDDILSPETIDRALAEWYDPDAVREWADRDEWPFFVAAVDGTVVGYVAGRLDVADGSEDEGGPATASLGAIYVDPDRWGEGVGGALLDRFEAACRAADRDAVRLRVLAANERALSFYRHNGYAVVDERDEELFGETVAECVLERRLD